MKNSKLFHHRQILTKRGLRVLATGFLAVFVSALSGCSDVSRIPVSGKVLFNGGAWPKAGVIYFNPLEPAEGHPRLSGTGTFETDGSFQVKAAGGTHGLVPGKYAVRVECWKVEPTMAKPVGVSYVPPEFEFPAVEIEVGASSKDVQLNVAAP